MKGLLDDFEQLTACRDVAAFRALARVLHRRREYAYALEDRQLARMGVVNGWMLLALGVAMFAFGEARWMLPVPMAGAFHFLSTEWLDWRRARDKCRALERLDPALGAVK